MAAKAAIIRNMFLGTTAIAGLALAGCNNSNDGFAGAAEIGQFGIVVGEPVAVISATRGQGASVDTGAFTVTFNNAEGTSITITTPEGEEITFDQDDPATWVGPDDDLGMDLARLVSADGDRLEVMIGQVRVPVAPEEDPEAEPAGLSGNGIKREDQLAFAVARLDENDTRDGFETYAVVGDLTDPANLPRYLADVTRGEDDEGNPIVIHAAGDLIEGTASYEGGFLASVYKEGEVLSDGAQGYSNVNIDFASGEVAIWMNGSYEFDDVDDTARGAVTNVTRTFTNGIVTGVTPVFGAINDDPNQDIVTNVVFDVELQDVVVSFAPFNTVDPFDIVTAVNVSFNNQDGITVVNNVSVTTASNENDDTYSVNLSGFGDGDDIDFNAGGTYTGDLFGYVETPSGDSYNGVETFSVAGEFGGAVFGPGESAFDVLDTAEGEFEPYLNQIIDATGTAGVFEANSNDPSSDDNATVEIVGAFQAESDGFCDECSVD